MDKKEAEVQLRILNITNSQAEIGAYAMLLEEVEGNRKLPIIIGAVEAQAIILYLKEMKTPRPLTHELFTTCLDALGVTITKILIYKAEEGVFFSYIYLKKENEIIRIDARTSDAIVLSIRSHCPVFINESVLKQECIQIPKFKEEDNINENNLSDSYSEISLEKALEQAIKNENYELAARIRDEIKQKKKI